MQAQSFESEAAKTTFRAKLYSKMFAAECKKACRQIAEEEESLDSRSSANNDSAVRTLAAAVKCQMAMLAKVLANGAGAGKYNSGEWMMDQLRISLPLKLANTLRTAITPLSKGLAIPGQR